MRLTTLWVTCSLILAAACATIERPDSELCIVNAPLKRRKCYNLRHDYDDSGNLIPEATPSYAPVESVEDLNKHTTMDPESWTRFRAYLKKLREQYQGTTETKQILELH